MARGAGAGPRSPRLRASRESRFPPSGANGRWLRFRLGIASNPHPTTTVSPSAAAPRGTDAPRPPVMSRSKTLYVSPPWGAGWPNSRARCYVPSVTPLWGVAHTDLRPVIEPREGKRRSEPIRIHPLTFPGPLRPPSPSNPKTTSRYAFALLPPRWRPAIPSQCQDLRLSSRNPPYARLPSNTSPPTSTVRQMPLADSPPQHPRFIGLRLNKPGDRPTDQPHTAANPVLPHAPAGGASSRETSGPFVPSPGHPFAPRYKPPPSPATDDPSSAGPAAAQSCWGSAFRRAPEARPTVADPTYSLRPRVTSPS